MAAPVAFEPLDEPFGEDHVEESAAQADPDAPPRASRKAGRRRRRTRGGSRPDREPTEPELPRRESSERELLDDEPDGHEPEETRDAPPLGEQGLAHDGKKKRRRGKRGGRGRRKGEAAPSQAPIVERPAPRGVTLEALPGEDDDDLPVLPELPDDAELLDGGRGGAGRDGARGSKGRKRRSRKKPAHKPALASRPDEDDDDLDLDLDLDDDEPVVEERKRDTQILVNSADHAETRVAVVRDGRILDFMMDVESEKSLVHDIYRGRVVNIETSIGAAFVDFGRGRNGFLHTSDVLPAYGDEDWNLTKLLSTNVSPEEMDGSAGSVVVDDEIDGGDDEHGAEEDGKPGGDEKKGRPRRPRFRARPRLPITDLLQVGERVVVQVTKDAIGDKGPTLTTYLSIPGRYLVLMPSISHTGVSRKIEDVKERKRLKRALDGLKIPEGMGVIARTAASGHTKAELKRDVDYLLRAWKKFSRELAIGHGPRSLYLESDVAIRTVRDLFGPETESVVVDDPEVFKSIVEFTEMLMPEHVHRIKMHEGPRPLFHAFNVEQDFERIFSRRIELPSGGSIVIDQAEALVAIDVNSGKTRTDGFDFEEIALKTNLEAAPEIARQIRLRDLGGILVLDFIDMMKRNNMRTVERAFRNELAKDRARSKIGRISQFGLLEMTRQRLGPGMDKKVFATCGRCRGSGRIRTIESRGAAILRRLGSALTLKGFSRIEVKAHPEVVEFLLDRSKEELKAMRETHGKEIALVSVPNQVEDSVVRYLRTDGREVRPGGRRKR